MKQLYQRYQLNNFLCQITNLPCDGVTPDDSPLYIDTLLESATRLLNKLQRLNQTPAIKQEIRRLTDYIQDIQQMSKGAKLRSALLNISYNDPAKHQSIKRHTKEILLQLQQRLRHPNSFFCFRSGWRTVSVGHSTSIILQRDASEYVTLTIGDRGADRDLAPSPLTTYRLPVSQIDTPEFQQCIAAFCSSIFVNSLESISVRAASQALHSLPLQHRIQGINEVVTGARYPLQQHKNCVINALLLSTRRCLGEKLGQEVELCLIENALRFIQTQRLPIPTETVEKLRQRQNVLLTPEDSNTTPIAPACYSGGGGEEKPSRERDNVHSHDQKNKNTLLFTNKHSNILRNLNLQTLKHAPLTQNLTLLKMLKTNKLDQKLEFLIKLNLEKKSDKKKNPNRRQHNKNHLNQNDTKFINIIRKINNKKSSPSTPKNEVNITDLHQDLNTIISLLLQQNSNGDNQKKNNELLQHYNINYINALSHSFKKTNILFQTIKPKPHTASQPESTLNTITFK